MAAKTPPPDESLNPLRDLNQWWFGYGSPVTLGVFRMIMGTLAFCSMALTAMDFQAWFTEKGFAPVGVVDKNWLDIPPKFQIGPNITVTLPIHTMPRIALLADVHDWRITLAFYIVVMLAAVFTALGLWSRVSTIALAIGMVSLHHRDPLILDSGDTLLRLSLIYLAVSPCGAACSLDRIIRLWRGTAPPEPYPVSLWPQRLIEYQVALIYFTTVWDKWFGTAWKDGTATFYPENLNEFNRFPVPDLIRHQPFIGFATYGTLVVELSLATLVFYKPIRKYVLMAGVAMHIYIEYRYNIPFFAFTIVSCYLCFYEGEEISAWAQRVGERLRKWRVLVEIPIHHHLQPNARRALAALDPFSLVSYDTGADANLKAIDLEGRPKNPFFSTWARSLGAWPIGLVPGMWKRLLLRACEESEPSPQPVGSGLNR